MLVVLSSSGDEMIDLLLQGLVEELLIHLKLAAEHSLYPFFERGSGLSKVEYSFLGGTRR